MKQSRKVLMKLGRLQRMQLLMPIRILVQIQIPILVLVQMRMLVQMQVPMPGLVQMRMLAQMRLSANLILHRRRSF